jgi:hypothetical protein
MLLLDVCISLANDSYAALYHEYGWRFLNSYESFFLENDSSGCLVVLFAEL